MNLNIENMAFRYLESLVQPSVSNISNNSDSDSDSNESDIENGIGETPFESVNNSEFENESSDDDSIGDDSDNEATPTENFPWSANLNPVEIDMFTSGVGPNLDNVNVEYQSQPLEFFKLFFPDNLIEIIADQTNLYAAQRNANNFTPVTVSDIQTFIYINMMFGVHKLPAYTMYWSTDPLLKVPCVADVMSRNRFQEISRYFHLADSRYFIPKGRDGYDALYKIRPVITVLKAACNSLYRPGAAIAFDEAMIPFRGRLSFKQYIKGKPHPWGVKVWCCCDSSTSFLLDFEFYTGKSDTVMPNGLGYSVIQKLGQPYLHKNHHFYFDNYFSSVKLAHDLLSSSTYSCATTRQNRRHWPKDLKGKLNKNQCQMRQIGSLVACWWRDKRAISMLSTNASPTMDTASRRTKEGLVDKQIPQSVLIYNANMGGVDRHDQLRSYYPIGRKSHKWWRCCLWFLIEVAALNAYILYKNMPRPPTSKPVSHFNFHMDIARSLMKGSSRKRRQVEVPAAGGLAVPGTSVEHRRIRLPGRKKQCFQCRQKNIRYESNRRPETVFGCVLCNTHLCDEMCFAQFHAQLN